MSQTALLAIVSGAISGFALGLVGGGGSILATPLLIYVVGIGRPHVAIGTGAVAVAASALVNFGTHAMAGNVRWRSAFVFAGIGIIGAFVGSWVGTTVDGRRLLVLLGGLMIIVAVSMVFKHDDSPLPVYEGRSQSAVAGLALFSGLTSGFFGVGGGFLIVPCLLYATSMPTIDAIGTSLLAVAAFSVATAANYARSGLIDWAVAGWFILGGIAGGTAGMALATRLQARKGLLRKLLALLIFALAIYVIAHSLGAILRR